MIKNVVFYNHWHNGDVHIGRGFIKRIMLAIVDMMEHDTVFSFAHKNPSNLLADIRGLGYDPKPLAKLSPYDGTRIHGDTAYINTWYCQDQNRYFRQYGLTFDALYSAMNDACKTIWKAELPTLGFGGFPFEPKTPEDFFPSINYSLFEIDKAQEWLKLDHGKRVLVENGQAQSKQATNFDMTPIVIEVARNQPSTTFILTTKDIDWDTMLNGRMPSNIVFSDDIIGKAERSDLNEISFLSTHCDMVVGRSSGVFTFCLTKENLFDRNMKFLSFAKPIVAAKPDKYWLGKRFENTLTYKAKTKVSHETEPEKVMEEIETWL